MKIKLLLCFVILTLQICNASTRSKIIPKFNGQPALLLAGELGNSSATCQEDIDRIFPHLKNIGLNCVLVPAYWDLLEPEEGFFDFTLTDYVLNKARENDLHVVFLWFGAWKNSMSCYAPGWFKTDWIRFPRVRTDAGKALEIASAFSEDVYEADCKAFTTWLKHVVDNDKEYGTVVMIQIENEIGMLESARDHSEIAEKTYQKWIESNSLDSNCQIPQNEIDERFTAEYYARYVERLAKEARKLTDVPLYVNAALNSRGRKPGEYPSGGPLAHLQDIWKMYAPTVDMMSPDIYDSGYKSWVSQYSFPGNTLFIPEIRLDENCGAKAMYAFGEKKAIGYSPFSIEDCPPDTKLRKAYDCLNELSPYIIKYRETDAINGVLFDQVERDTTIVNGGINIQCSHFFTLPWDSRATDGSRWPEGGGIIIRIAPMEYLIAGTGIVVTFDSQQSTMLGEDGFVIGNDNLALDLSVNNTLQNLSSRYGILSCDQVTILPDGTLKYIRRLNGDQDHQGRHVRIGVDDYQILHVKLYEYE